jgi:hypothetical protein
MALVAEHITQPGHVKRRGSEVVYLSLRELTDSMPSVSTAREKALWACQRAVSSGFLAQGPQIRPSTGLGCSMPTCRISGPKSLNSGYTALLAPHFATLP